VGLVAGVVLIGFYGGFSVAQNMAQQQMIALQFFHWTLVATTTSQFNQATALNSDGITALKLKDGITALKLKYVTLYGSD